MNEDDLRQECLRMLENIYQSSHDVAYPIHDDGKDITLCGSAERYVLSTDFGPKTYSDAKEVLEALIAVEHLYDEDDPLRGVYLNLSHIS